MKTVRITAVRRSEYTDLMEQYEQPMENGCDTRIGAVFESLNAKRPEGFCESAWETIEPFVKELANGGGHFFGAWMKNPYSAMLSCNDGFRPVSFLVEALEENTRSDS